MKRTVLCPVCTLLVLTLVLISPVSSYADASGGGSAATSVADAVHAGAEVGSLADQFNTIMDQFDREESADRRKMLLQEADNILSRLIARANDVESEISILSRKKLDKVYANKLDRVLANVQNMRQMAQARMAAASQAG
jgi:2C-methyl-D-erythritol 2,4-cyclodiphosphate synthase